MKITRLSVFQVDVPVSDGGYQFSKGKRVELVDSTVVRIDTDEGISGWGEACPLGPFYLPSFAQGLRAGIDLLAPHVLGLDPTLLGALNQVMDRELRGHNYVKSPIDVACWDILGKVAGLPIHALLGGRRHESLAMYRSISQGTPARMQDAAEKWLADGYGHIQLKVGADPGDDIERIQAVAKSMPSDAVLLADGNTGWRRDEALRVAMATEDLDYILEQPCERYADNLSVRRRTNKRFKLDESLQSVHDVTQSLSDDAMDVACIKITKFAGLTKSLLARDLCASAGIPMTVEDVWGCEIVTAALGQLAISTPPDAFLNTTDLHNYNDVHIADGAPVVVDGHLEVSDRPGLGVEPHLDVLGDPVSVYKEPR